MSKSAINRRGVLIGGASTLAAASGCLAPRMASANVREFNLVAAPAQMSLAGAKHPVTEVWCYDQKIPGPEIRVRQGERIRVSVENRLSEETTVHWHGIRLPNAMDGVSHLTQKPITPGGRFVYEFECPMPEHSGIIRITVALCRLAAGFQAP